MLATTMQMLLLAGAVIGQGLVNVPFPAHRVIGNLYYVGSKDLASYLITTPEGHILINSSFDSTVPLIQANVESLGFKMSDIKILLASHAHSDHVAGHAERACGHKPDGKGEVRPALQQHLLLRLQARGWQGGRSHGVLLHRAGNARLRKVERIVSP